MTSLQTFPEATSPQRPRLLFADDHRLVLDALTFVLSPEYEVLTVDSLRACEEALMDHFPDVLILDIRMPDGDGIETARRLIREYPRLKVMFLSMHTEPGFVERAAETGAKAYLSKQAPAQELASAIRTVLEGGRYFASQSQLPETAGSIQGNVLTERQREVLRLIARGSSAKEIATALRISVRTAEFHRAAIMNRLNLHSTAMMTRYALQNSLE